jgi:uncharacterized membrane-anchored protein YhcB (DUF1043 family)
MRPSALQALVIGIALGALLVHLIHAKKGQS